VLYVPHNTHLLSNVSLCHPTVSLTVSPRHSLRGPQSPSASEGAWSSPQGRHCSAGSGRGPQPQADLDGTERQGHTGTGDELHTDTLKHTPHVHMHGTRVYVMCTYIHTHSHTHCTYVHAYTHIHTYCTYCTHNIQPHIRTCLPTSDGDGSHSIVDHTACEVCQQDAGGCQEHTCHCCTVLHQHCHSTGVLTTDHWREERGEERRGKD